MEFIGVYLKSIRIKRQCTIEELSNELMISQNLLTLIEEDNFPDHLSSVYTMGHIRSYANFFDLDADDLIKSFKIQISYNHLEESHQLSKPIKTIDLFTLKKTFYFASISLISISFYLMFVRPNNLDHEYAMTPNLPENLLYNLEEIEMNLSLKKNKNAKISSSKINELNSDEVIKNIHEEFEFSNSSSAIASTPKDLFTADSVDKITLHFLNPTWIQLRDFEGKIIISKLMNEGDEYSYGLLEKLNLTAGNAGNIIVSLNGIVKGRIGKVGDVVESFIIDKDFKN